MPGVTETGGKGDSGIYFEALGPLRLTVGGEVIPLRSRKRRALIGMLLAHRDRALSVDQLLQAVYPESDGTRNALYWHIHQFRQVLDNPDRLTMSHDGYRLRVDTDENDVARFEALRSAGLRAMDEDLPKAGQLLEDADRIWRGTPYEGLTEIAALKVQADRLEELRFDALNRRYEAELALGRHAGVISELSALVRQYPFRDGLRAHLMLALYRSGRQDDALRVYRVGRQQSIERLGLEPGPELSGLELAILNQSPTLEPPHRSDTSRRAPATISATPAELPPRADTFTGRSAESTALRELVMRQIHSPTGFVVVSGVGGVGKSLLANQVAHQIAASFPGGQLYVDMKGANPDAVPVKTDDVLRRFLRSCGDFGGYDSADTDELAARFRTVTKDRRVLLLLDDVHSASQIEPLLPSETSCVAMVTSRRRLPALRNSVHYELGPMTHTDSVELLRRRLPTTRQPGPLHDQRPAVLCNNR